MMTQMRGNGMDLFYLCVECVEFVAQLFGCAPSHREHRGKEG